MRDLKRDMLLVSPNPFLPEPPPCPSLPIRGSSPSRPRRHSRRSITRLHSLRQEALALLAEGAPTKRVLSPIALSLTRVSPLTELCFCLLLAPSVSNAGQTVLEDYHELELSDLWVIPLNERQVLVRHVSGSRSTSSRLRINARLECARTDVSELGARGLRVCKACVGEFWGEHLIAGVDVGGGAADMLRMSPRFTMQDSTSNVDMDPDVATAVLAVLGSVHLTSTRTSSTIEKQEGEVF